MQRPAYLLYQLNASRNYDPSPQLEKITARVMWINSEDDFINLPELGIAQREAKHLKNGDFILIPASEQTHGHGFAHLGSAGEGAAVRVAGANREVGVQKKYA